MVSDKRI